MDSLVRNLGTPAVLIQETAPVAAALVIAEVFCHFHSFSLECPAFPGAWAMRGGAVHLGERLLGRANQPGGEA
jgi:hypothetical protein